MRRDTRNLLNLKGSRVQVSTKTPIILDFADGEEKYYVLNGALYLYKRIGAKVYLVGNGPLMTAVTTDSAIDHGALAGLGDDDHTIYLLATGARTLSGVLRGATSLYRRYYHVVLGSANPGASGPTWVPADANTTGGWNLDADSERLRGQVDIHSDWDGASDLKFSVRWCTDEDNSGGADADTVDFTLVVRYKGVGDTAVKSQTITAQSTTIGKAARYKQFTTTFTIDWDATSNVVEVGDVVSVNLNFVTATSEVTDVIVTSMEFYYNTTHLGIESGDT